MITTEAMVAEAPKKNAAPAMPGGGGRAGWIIDRPTKRRQGHGDAALFIVCRAMFGGEEPVPPQRRRFHVLFVVARRESLVFALVLE